MEVPSVFRTILKFWNSKLALVYPFVFLPLLFLDEGDDTKWKCTYVVALMACYTVLEPVPLGVTGLMPLILFPVLGILGSDKVAEIYMTEANMSMFGSITLVLAYMSTGVHKRLCYKLMMTVGVTPIRLMSGIYWFCFSLGMWLSNTGLTIMMTPVCLMAHQQLLTVEEADPEIKGETEDQKLARHKKNENIKRMMLFSVSVGVSVACKATIMGNTSGYFYISLLKSAGTFTTDEISFSSWLCLNMPMAIVNGLLAWGFLIVYFMGFSSVFRFKKKHKNKAGAELVTRSIAEKGLKLNLELEERHRHLISAKYEELGPWTVQEKFVFFHFLTVLLLLIFRNPKFIEGWSKLFSHKMKVGDSTVFITSVFLLLLIPKRFFDGWTIKSVDEVGKSSSSCWEPFLDWSYVLKRFPWDIIFIAGGAYALGEGLQLSKLADFIADNLTFLDDLSPFVISLIVTYITGFFCQIISGRTWVAMVVPILLKLSIRMEIHPLYLTMPIAVCISYGFVLPSSSTMNLIIYSLSEGTIRLKDFLQTGTCLNIICLTGLIIMNPTWGEVIFQYSQYSNSCNATLGCSSSLVL